MIAVTFAALDYRMPERNQYAYKLKGLQDEWIQNGTNRTATFTNLSPGRYTLKVKGSNNDGVWNETPTEIAIRILPPWWATWYAYVFYVLASLSLIALVFRLRVNRVRLKARMKMEQSMAQNLLEVDKMKSRFFANISHEFRRPLTLIMGRSQKISTNQNGLDYQSEAKQVNRHAKHLLNLVNQFTIFIYSF